MQPSPTEYQAPSVRRALSARRIPPCIALGSPSQSWPWFSVATDEDVVPASELRAAEQRIKELERAHSTMTEGLGHRARPDVLPPG